MSVQEYNKLIIAVVGLCLMLLREHTGFDMTNNAAIVSDVVIAAITAYGVYRVRNKTPDPKELP